VMEMATDRVWIVGISDAESNVIRYVCSSKEKALKRWDELRKELIDELKTHIILCEREKQYSDNYKKIMDRCLTNLQIMDPGKLNNYPQEEPYICEMELE